MPNILDRLLGRDEKEEEKKEAPQRVSEEAARKRREELAARQKEMEEARKQAALLGHNFPNSKWYVEAYALIEDPTIKNPQGADEPWYKLW